MCRHLAWLGKPRSLSSLILDTQYGLLRQSYQPRRQRHGTMNADGWGVGFFSASLPTPARWRSNRPLWSHASFASVAPAITSQCFIASVRSASPGMPPDESAAAPFACGSWLLSHNGVLDRSVLGPHPAAESMCDSAQLAAHLSDFGPERLAEFVTTVGSRDPTARLNLLLIDGHQILATRWNDTLSVLRADDGVAVASEPFDDDPRWVDVPEHHLVQVTASTVTITALETGT